MRNLQTSPKRPSSQADPAFCKDSQAGSLRLTWLHNNLTTEPSVTDESTITHATKLKTCSSAFLRITQTCWPAATTKTKKRQTKCLLHVPPMTPSNVHRSSRSSMLRGTRLLAEECCERLALRPCSLYRCESLIYTPTSV